MARRILIVGPAYLDRVLRVDRPLVPDHLRTGPIDLSVGGAWDPKETDRESLGLSDPDGYTLIMSLPEGWPEGFPTWIDLDRPLLTHHDNRPSGPVSDFHAHMIESLAFSDHLGGMGAGFASALGGTLVSALGPESDPTSARIAELLAGLGIDHRPIRVPDHEADWTLLISSGPFGDKLPVGFRGCHAALSGVPESMVRGDWDVLVVASLTNRLARSALEAVEARVRVFAPTLRNMTDRDPPLSSFAGRIDLLACNRHEWQALADREAVAEAVPVVSITDGPAGGIVRFRDPDSGAVQEHRERAFLRSRPPRDTNRAGEAYASTLLTALLDAGWRGGPAPAGLIRPAARRASAAAGLVLDREDFGFPTPEEIDLAVERGRIR